MPYILTPTLVLRCVAVGAFLFLWALPVFSLEALTVAPARIEISAEPGDVVQTTVELRNDEGRERTYYASAENFEASGERGTPRFVPSDRGLATWIDAPASVTLASGETREIEFVITIPEDARPGGEFAGLLWATTPPEGHDEGGQVAVGAKLGTIILLSIAGDIDEGGGIIEFSTVTGEKFFTHLPVAMEYRFRNEGDDRVRPEGSVAIRNMIGMEVESLSANPTARNILPRGDIQGFDIVWGDTDEDVPEGFFSMAGYQARHFAFGRYTATVAVNYGRGLEHSDEERLSVWVIPWQLLSIVSVVLILLFLILRLGIRRYNAMIIHQAQQAMGGKHATPPEGSSGSASRGEGPDERTPS